MAEVISFAMIAPHTSERSDCQAIAGARTTRESATERPKRLISTRRQGNGTQAIGIRSERIGRGHLVPTKQRLPLERGTAIS